MVRTYVDNAENRRTGRGNTNPPAARGNSTHSAAQSNSTHSAARGNSTHSAARDNRTHSAARGNSTHSAARGNSTHSAARDNSTHSAARDNSTHSAARDNSTPSPRLTRTPVENESSSTNTTKTYVDNAYNRRVGSVGLPHGTAKASATDRRSPGDESGYNNLSTSRPSEVSRSGNSSTSTIIANEQTRHIRFFNGTAGAHTSARDVRHPTAGRSRTPTEHSKRSERGSSRASPTMVTYRGRNNASPVFNERRFSNDSVTRIKTTHCKGANRSDLNYTESTSKAPNLYDDLACGESPREESHSYARTPSITFNELKDYDHKAATRGKTKTEKRYADNYYNRTLLHGESVISKYDEARGERPKTSTDEVDVSVNTKRCPQNGAETKTKKRYADNPYNRKHVRVGLLHGEAVISKYDEARGERPKTSTDEVDVSVNTKRCPQNGAETKTKNRYTDNYYIRKPVCVGLLHGEAVISKYDEARGERPKTSTDEVNVSVNTKRCPQNGAETKTKNRYTDNYYIRKPVCVGLLHGEAVISKYDEARGERPKTSTDEVDVSVNTKRCPQNGAETKTKNRYTDNYYIRKPVCVGLLHGEAVISKYDEARGERRKTSTVEVNVSVNTKRCPQNGAETKTKKRYADNPYNRKHDRVGLLHGEAVISKYDEARGERRKTSTDEVEVVVNTKRGQQNAAPLNNDAEPKTGKRYADNYYNRKADRVGLLHDEAVIPKKDEAKHECLIPNDVEYVNEPNSEVTKRYANTSQNRKLDRVGLPLGTMVYSQKTNDITRRVYKDSPLNRILGRAGKPLGSIPRKSTVTYKIPEIIEKLRKNEISETSDDDGIPDVGMFESKDPSKTAYRQAICHHNRQRAERSWQMAYKEPPRTEMSILTGYNGKKIDFDEIKLHSRIGRGGFGEVYFAKWRETVVAVKKLRTEKFTDRNIVTFAEEVKKFCELDHPNIVKFIGACTDMPDVCIVMEYMQYSLFDAIHVHKLNFHDKDILSITQQVCKGIKYLHERRIAHCDIKTANILMDYVDNSICEAKITDFGLSVMMQDTSVTLSRGEFVSPRGTLRYSAPEILRGDVLCLRDMMHTDVYSLGLVLFEIIYFEEPYHDLSAAEMRHQVGEIGVTPEISNDVNVDEDVLDIIRKTWQFEPHLRPKVREISEVMNRRVSIFVDNEY